jgi:glycosyltransferase involved in cell wall biosynthesis
VKFSGKISDSDLHTYYQNSDAFLLLSLHEGFCVPIIEAQSHSLPLIGLDRTATAETMGPDQLVFAEEDCDELAAAVRVVSQDVEIQEFLKKNGKLNCEKYSELNLQKCYAKLLITEE